MQKPLSVYIYIYMKSSDAKASKCIYIYIYIYMKSSDAKASKCIYIYIIHCHSKVWDQ